MSYMVLAAIVIFLGIFAVIGIKTMNDNTSQLYVDQLQPTGNLVEVVQLLENTRVQMLSGIIEENPSRGDDALANIEQLNQVIDHYANHDLTSEEQEILNDFQENWNAFSDIVQQNVLTLTSEQYDELHQGLTQGRDFFQAARSDIKELTALNEELANNAYQDSNHIYSTLLVTIIISSIVAILLTMIIGIFMGRSIGIPMNKLASRLSEVAAGDLRGEHIKTKRKDEIGELVTSTNDMQNQLKQLITSITNATDKVLSSSEELTQSANEVMAGSQQITSTMEELAAGAESEAHHTNELSALTSSFATKVEEANENGLSIQQSSGNVLGMTVEGQQLMETSTQQMNKIDEIVKDAVEKMQNLDTQSQKISELVSVIQAIAEQTNLLALNASIEAARAGEHGQGFTIVANEVRNLAEGVAVSVTDITDIVNDIQLESNHVTESLQTGYKEVEQGTSQIAETGEMFSEISKAVNDMVTNIQTVTNNLSEITEGSQQMSSSIQEIAAISEESAAGVEETTASAQQTNSAMQEITASSDDLAHLAEDLNKFVKQFKL